MLFKQTRTAIYRAGKYLPSNIDTLSKFEILHDLTVYLAQVPDREAELLRLRWGIGVPNPLSVRAVAELLGMSRSPRFREWNTTLSRNSVNLLNTSLEPAVFISEVPISASLCSLASCVMRKVGDVSEKITHIGI